MHGRQVPPGNCGCAEVLQLPLVFTAVNPIKVSGANTSCFCKWLPSRKEVSVFRAAARHGTAHLQIFVSLVPILTAVSFALGSSAKTAADNAIFLFVVHVSSIFYGLIAPHSANAVRHCG